MNDELNLIDTDSPDLSDEELLKAAKQFNYLKKVFKGSAELEDNFLFSLHEYPELNLVQRFYHLFGMAIADHISVDVVKPDALIDDEVYSMLLEDVNSFTDDVCQSNIYNYLVNKHFPDSEKEIEDPNNIKYIKIGTDEELFMNNIDRIDDGLLFFNSFDAGYVGLKRFEGSRKLEYVYQMIMSNYYNELRLILNDSADCKTTIFELVTSFLTTYADGIVSLPDKEAVAYTTTQLYGGLESNRISEYYLADNHYRRKMNEGYKTLIDNHPELNTPYSASEYKKSVEEDIKYQNGLNNTKEVKTKTLYS